MSQHAKARPAALAQLQAQVEALTVQIDKQAEELARLKAAPPPAVAPRPPAGASPRQVGRRRVLTQVLGATAVAAALTAGKEAAPAAAVSNTTVSGASTDAYGLLATPGTVGAADPPMLGTTTHGVIGSNSASTVLPISSGVAGARSGQGRAGVLGANGSDGYGVYGISAAAQGVYGTSATFYGVQGVSSDSTGTLGQSNNGVGVQGASNGNVGVLGTSNTSVGVYASSDTSTGLYATSSSGTGIVASTNGGNAIQGASNANVGLLGTSQSSIGVFAASGTSTGLYATGPAAGFAARFDGPVLVNGDFTAMGGSKSAAVPHPDGSHRRLYCVESPESWFEDFGQDQLVNGRARVRLDRDFNALVRGDRYDVFLTPYGDTKGLYVSDKNPNSFEVREVQGGTSNLAFCYRVVAKRRDIPGLRLAKVDIPPRPTRLAAPPPPAIPPVPPLPNPHGPRPAPSAGPER